MTLCVTPAWTADEATLGSRDKTGPVSVRDKQGLVAALRTCEPGDQVEVVVRRGKQKKTLPVTLGTLGR
ncbi:MAG: hypothetical protein ACODAD_05840 [Planctomycetota bacterium]